MNNNNLFLKRSAAFLLDLLVVYVTARVAGLNHGELLVAWLVYECFSVYWKGFTMGKYCLGLKVKSASKKRVFFSMALLRAIGKLVSTLVLFLGDVWMLWDEKAQTWHDRLAKTAVAPNAK